MTHFPIFAHPPITIAIDGHGALLSARRIELEGQGFTQITMVVSEGILFCDTDALTVVDIPDDSAADDFSGIVQTLAARLGTQVSGEELAYLSDRLFW